MDDEVTLCYVGSELPLSRKRLPASQQLRRMRQTSQGKGRMAILLKMSVSIRFWRIISATNLIKTRDFQSNVDAAPLTL